MCDSRNIHTPPMDGSSDNPHILKYVSYDRSRLLQPCGKLFSWAPPVPLGIFYPLAPPNPLGISIDHPLGGGGGMDIFWNHTICFRKKVWGVNRVVTKISS